MSERSGETRREELMRMLRDEGVHSLNEQELVELLLLFSSRQNDTHAAVYWLFKKIGSFSDILETSVAELLRFDGISMNGAVLISMVPQIVRRIQIVNALKSEIKGMDAVRLFVSKCFIGMTEEHFLLVCLDREKRLLRYEYISSGTVVSSMVDMRKITDILIASGASFAVVAHNHPRGSIFPSSDDLMATQNLAEVLGNVKIGLLDHLIVNSRSSFSFAESWESVRRCLISNQHSIAGGEIH